MGWWHYLLLVNLYLVLFFGFYRAFLHRETFFQLNRVYLVAGSLLSFLIPLMQADWIRGLFITQKVHQTLYAAVGPELIYAVKPAETDPVTVGQILVYIYIVGAALLLARLVYQLFLVSRLFNSDNAPAAFSFFNKIKVDIDLPGQRTIIEHEQVHTSQWHSADVLLIEAMMIINWFNPVVYFYRKAIKHVHEYIADRKAIETGTSKAEYAMLLLSQTFGTVPHQLTNNFFNHSLLKQRIVMLNKNGSDRRALLKYGLSAPLFAAMLILSSATVNNSKIIKVINKKAEQALAIRSVNFADDVKGTFSEDAVIHSAGIPEANRIAADEGNVSLATDISPVEMRKDSAGKVNDNDQNTRNIIFNAVEVSPTFPGGEQEFGRFLAEHIRYPAKAREARTTGRVFISFVVEKDGSLSDIKCLRDPGDGLGQEAIRVLNISPKWNPGIQNGRRVRMQFTVPVNFMLADDDAKKKALDTVRAIGIRKPAMVFTYKHTYDPDSVKEGARINLDQRVIAIRLNGRTISSEELLHIKPSEIGSMSIVKKGDTSKTVKGVAIRDMIFISTKQVKPISKG